MTLKIQFYLLFKERKLKKLTLDQIEQLAENALNAACLVIQTTIGQTDGGNASIFFSGDEVKNQLIAYIDYEMLYHACNEKENQL